MAAAVAAAPELSQLDMSTLEGAAENLAIEAARFFADGLRDLALRSAASAKAESRRLAEEEASRLSAVRARFEEERIRIEAACSEVQALRVHLEEERRRLGQVRQRLGKDLCVLDRPPMPPLSPVCAKPAEDRQRQEAATGSPQDGACDAPHSDLTRVPLDTGLTEPAQGHLQSGVTQEVPVAAAATCATGLAAASHCLQLPLQWARRAATERSVQLQGLWQRLEEWLPRKRKPTSIPELGCVSAEEEQNAETIDDLVHWIPDSTVVRACRTETSATEVRACRTEASPTEAYRIKTSTHELTSMHEVQACMLETSTHEVPSCRVEMVPPCMVVTTAEEALTFRVSVGVHGYAVLPDVQQDESNVLQDMFGTVVVVPRGWEVLSTSVEGFPSIIAELTKHGWGTSLLCVQNEKGRFSSYRTRLYTHGGDMGELLSADSRVLQPVAEPLCTGEQQYQFSKGMVLSGRLVIRTARRNDFFGVA